MCAAALVVSVRAGALLGPGERKRAMAWQLILKGLSTQFRTFKLRGRHTPCAQRVICIYVCAYVHELYLFRLGAEDAEGAQSIQLYVVVME